MPQHVRARTGQGALVLVLMSSVASGPVTAQVSSLETPARQQSGMFSLAASPEGEVFLSWIEPSGDDGHAFRLSRLADMRWAPPTTIATGRDWFVNWADHPAVAVVDARTLVAHWLVRSGTDAGTYGYGIRVARSTDAGATWHRVGDAGIGASDDYSGFVSWLVEPDHVRMAYLTPLRPSLPAIGHDAAARGTGMPAATSTVAEAPMLPDRSAAAHETHEEARKTLAIATVTPHGLETSRVLTLDDDTCQCCTTSSAITSDGAVIVYRDHLPEEIRDIAIVRESAQPTGWTAPATVARDGWVMPGCPTNGPVVAARDRRAAVAWFTAAHDTPRVKLAFSDDAGATFDAPMEVGAEAPHGWPAIVMLDDGSAVVSWMEGTGADGDVRLRRVWRDGRMTAPLVVAKVRAGRAAGIPQMVRRDDALIVAWRTDRVETAMVDVPGEK